jgi:hypothetical protein
MKTSLGHCGAIETQLTAGSAKDMKKMDGAETGRWAQQFSILGSEKGFRIGESNPGLPRSFMWHFPPELHVGSCLFLFSTLFLL